MTASLPTHRPFAETVTASGEACPACASKNNRKFYAVDQVPVHQVRLVRTREAAIDCPKGDIRLHFCEDCGFVWNAAFNAELVTYEEDYESTQAVSPTFNTFHDRLAKQLAERYDLRGKEVFEIGCGQGEFMSLLCREGARHATGFDPVLRDIVDDPKLTFVKDWYSEAYAHLRPDFIGSKMVMEHVPDPGRYLSMLRRALGDRPDVLTFAMMPEVTRILDLRAFWDVYYEHCTYFSLGSLARAHKKAGFDVVDLRTDFGDQYALITARPGTGECAPKANEETPQQLAKKVDAFAEQVAKDRMTWSDWLAGERAAGRRVVVWGGGSKGVSFLTTLGITDEIELAIDINANRNGTFIAGTGQRIGTPDALATHQPDTVVIMSPIYRNEIRASLAELGLTPRLISIEAGPHEDLRDRAA
ncbi:MAG: class I SAM-dependent methyltransferase [Geminicoccaceae bacterium]